MDAPFIRIKKVFFILDQVFESFLESARPHRINPK